MKWIKFKQVIRYFPLAVISAGFFLLPHYYSKGIEGFIKINFYMIWWIGCLCWLWSVLLSSLKFSEIPISLVIAILYIVFLTFIQLDDNSLHFLNTFVCLIGIVHYLRIFFLRKNIFWLITASIILSYFVQISIGFIQAIDNGWTSFSIQGQLSNSGYFANYLIAFLPFGFQVALRNELKNYLRTGLIIILILSFILLCLTGARSALIGCLGGVCVILFFHRIRLSTRALVIILLCILLIPFIGYQLYHMKYNSAQGRLTIYKITCNIIKDHSAIGIGPNRFSAVYNNYQAAYFEDSKVSIQQQVLADNTFEAFNFILQILVEYGFIGLGLLLSIILYLLKRVKIGGSNSSYVIGSFASIVSLLISGLFSNPFHLTPVFLVLCYHISIIYPISNEKYQRNRTFQNFAIPFVFTLIFSSFVVWYSFDRYVGAINWARASRTAVFNSFSRAEIFYEKAYSSLNNNGDFLFNYGAEACIGKRYKKSIQLLERAKRFYSSSNLYVYLGNAYSAMNQFEKAEKNYLTSIYIAPSHIYPKYQLIQLYKKWEKTDEMKFWIEKTINFPIKIKSEFANELILELKNLN